MKYRFPTGKALEEVSGLIKNRLGKPAIPGFSSTYIGLEKGTAMVQTYRYHSWTLQYLVLEHKRPVVLEWIQREPARVFFAILEGECRWQDHISGIQGIKQHRGMMLTVPNLHSFVCFKGTKKLSRALVITRKLPADNKRGTKGIFSMNVQMQALLQEILFSNYEQPLPFHLEHWKQLIHMADALSQLQQLKPAHANESFENIRALKQYIDTNIFNPLDLQKLSMVCAMNSRKMNLSFKEIYGETVMQYIRSERLNLAREAILYTDRTFAAIARDSLYKTYANFASAFKMKFGKAPGLFRNE